MVWRETADDDTEQGSKPILIQFDVFRRRRQFSSAYNIQAHFRVSIASFSRR